MKRAENSEIGAPRLYLWTQIIHLKQPGCRKNSIIKYLEDVRIGIYSGPANTSYSVVHGTVTRLENKHLTVVRRHFQQLWRILRIDIQLRADQQPFPGRNEVSRVKPDQTILFWVLNSRSNVVLPLGMRIALQRNCFGAEERKRYVETNTVRPGIEPSTSHHRVTDSQINHRIVLRGSAWHHVENQVVITIAPAATFQYNSALGTLVDIWTRRFPESDFSTGVLHQWNEIVW